MKRVIEEYIRPARYVENGFEVVRPALSDPEYMGKYPECVKFMQNGLHDSPKVLNICGFTCDSDQAESQILRDDTWLNCRETRRPGA